jgi:Spy/CpxP family protein refolding chaperone
MKNLFLALLFILIQAAVLNAQDQPPGPPPGGEGGPGQMSPKERVKDLKTKLNLTDDQAKKIEQIFTEDQKKMQAMFEKREEGGFEQMKKAMDAINEKSDAAINKILTAEQKTKYKKIVDERKKQQERMGPPPGGEF